MTALLEEDSLSENVKADRASDRLHDLRIGMCDSNVIRDIGTRGIASFAGTKGVQIVGCTRGASPHDAEGRGLTTGVAWGGRCGVLTRCRTVIIAMTGAADEDAALGHATMVSATPAVASNELLIASAVSRCALLCCR